MEEGAFSRPGKPGTGLLGAWERHLQVTLPGRAGRAEERVYMQALARGLVEVLQQSLARIEELSSRLRAAEELLQRITSELEGAPATRKRLSRGRSDRTGDEDSGAGAGAGEPEF